MKVINPSFEIIEQDCSELIKMSAYQPQKIAHLKTGIYKHIEKCGRTCYKSLDKITDDSCYGFVERMIKSNHTAMLEHGTVYLTVDKENKLNPFVDIKLAEVANNAHSKVDWVDNICYVTTNLRVINEIFKDDRSWEEYMTAPTENHERRYTVKFVCNRQVSHEFVRHRVFSFAQESTRYCNYTKDKFGNELTFIEPIWCDHDELSLYCKYQTKDRAKTPESAMMSAFNTIENNYNYLIEAGWKPQQAATILPNAIKTELIMTGFESDWVHFFNLRALGTTGKPHPQAEELAKPLMEEFIHRGYIKY